MRQVGIGIVEEEFSCGGLALTVHARPIHGEGDAPHEQWLPEGLLQNDPLRLQHELLAQVGVGCSARLRHQDSDVVAARLHRSSA